MALPFILRAGIIGLVLVAALPIMLAQEPEIEPESEVLEQFTIIGGRTPDQTRTGSSIASVLDRSDFTVRGDSDVAAALRRTSGVSIADGKFIFVRGLNERYSNSTFNGSILPSPEPLRKVAPLDLFPTSILESAQVKKTFSVENSAEFGGGAIDIRVRDATRDVQFEARFSLGYDSTASLRRTLLHQGGSIDALGIDSGLRSIPQGLEEAFNQGNYGDLSLQTQNALSREIIEHSELMVLQQGPVSPDFAGQVIFSNRLDFTRDISLGFLTYVSYDYAWNAKQGVQGIGQAFLQAGESVGEANTLSRFERQSVTNSAELNGLLSWDVELGLDHKLKGLVFVSHATDKISELATGFTADDSNVRREKLAWIERQLVTGQVQGVHTIPEAAYLEILWRGSASSADRDAPYGFTHEYETSQDLLRTGSNVSFSEIDDQAFDFGLDMKLPLEFGQSSLDVKWGFAWSNRIRNAQSHSLIIQNIPEAYRSQRVDYAYFLTFYDSDLAAFSNPNSSAFPAFYRGDQTVYGYYLGLDSQITHYLRVSAGVRGEDFFQSIETRTGRDVAGLVLEPFKQNSWHPEISAIIDPHRDLQLRLGYSRTVNRPQFREVGPSRFSSPDTNEQYTGNPLLVPTTIDNVDLRAEYYLGSGQSIALSGFFKNLIKPIEAYNAGQGESRLVTYVNIDAALVWGLEAEYSQTIALMDWVDSQSWLADYEINMQANFTWSDSRIQADSDVLLLRQDIMAILAQSYAIGDLTGTLPLSLLRSEGAIDEIPPDFEPGRALQGQSEFLVNVQLGWNHVDTGRGINLLLNYQSDRIRSVESYRDDSPAIIERPPVSLDLVCLYPIQIGDNMLKMRLKITNLLNQPYYAYQRGGNGSEVVVDRYSEGVSASLRIAYEY